MVYRSSNPALNPQYFQGGMAAERMTLDGTINKTLTLLGLVSIAAMLSYSIVSQNSGLGFLMIIGAGIGGFVLALAIMFIRPNNPQILMSMYALLEGLFIGGFSYMIGGFFGDLVGVYPAMLIACMLIMTINLLVLSYSENYRKLKI